MSRRCHVSNRNIKRTSASPRYRGSSLIVGTFASFFLVIRWLPPNSAVQIIYEYFIMLDSIAA